MCLNVLASAGSAAPRNQCKLPCEANTIILGTSARRYSVRAAGTFDLPATSLRLWEATRAGFGRIARY